MKKAEMARKMIENGTCRIFADWNEHTGITAESFISALEWLDADPMECIEMPDGSAVERTTREIKCREDGTIQKLRRVNNKDGSFAGFYDESEKRTVSGSGMMLNAKDRI